jgi:RNA-directed DNA polymerase
MEGIMRFLTAKLRLKVNESKSAVARPKDRKFLGFSFTCGEVVKRRIAPTAILRLTELIRELTRRTHGISIEGMIEELCRYIIGWRVSSDSAKPPAYSRTWKD